MTQSFRLARFVTLAGALAATTLVTPARASIADCGNIHVAATATCKAEVGVDCKAKCTPVSVQAACAGQFEGTCETTCNKPPEVSCTGSCETDCNTQCSVKPAAFDCEGSCTGKCEGTCAAKCSASSTTADGGVTDTGACEAQCKATCSGECHGSCTGTPPTADCTGKCQASCAGSCKADLNMDCQTRCQGKGFVDCQANLQGGCEVACDDPKGALFCDTQFVDQGNDAQKCVDALKAYLASHVVASASGSASCGMNVCTAQGEAQASCHCSTPARSRDTTGPGALLAALAGVVLASRRRRR